MKYKRTMRKTGFILAGILTTLSVFVYVPVGAFAAEGDVAVDGNNFPDDVFRSYVSENIDLNHNNVLSREEIEQAVCISCDGLGIADLGGIGFFTSVQELYCGNNKLNSLDVSNNKALQVLQCAGNKLTGLDVSYHTVLNFLDCDYNSLSSLNVNGCTALTNLICYNNRLTALDLSTNTALTSLECKDNRLTSLNLSVNTALTFLDCSVNQLTNLDISKNTNLTSVFCHENSLTVLDIHYGSHLMNAYVKGVLDEVPGYSKMYYTDTEYVCIDPNVKLLVDAKGLNSVVVIFDDIKYKNWFVEAVQYMYDNGLMKGKTETLFKPADRLSREEITQILYSKEGKPAVTDPSPFSDVGEGKWYTASVIWAQKNGIAAGKPDGSFGVGNPITRQDLALILYKFAVLKGYDLSRDDGAVNGYADTEEVSDYAMDAMNWAVSQGIISGKGAGGAPKSELRLDPKGNASRAECAAMIKQLCEKNNEKGF